MQRVKSSKHRFIGIMSATFLICIFFIVFFLIPFVRHETQLATQIPLRVTEQIQKRHEIYTPGRNISIYVKEAAISSQDKRFYRNLGVDVPATLRALYFTFTTHKRQGASTITEQLAKNVYFHDQDTLKTDIETKILALFITFRFSKDKILEMYLNDIYYGNGSYGIDEAARQYFQTTPSKLTLFESAYIMALINAPSYLSRHKAQANREAETVLQEMVRDHYISKNQANSTENGA